MKLTFFLDWQKSHTSKIILGPIALYLYLASLCPQYRLRCHSNIQSQRYQTFSKDFVDISLKVGWYIK